MKATLDPETARIQAWARACAESDLDAATVAASARLSESTDFLFALQREKSNRAATLANLQAAGIDPKDATAGDWFRAVHAVPDDGRPAAERLTPIWFRACLTRDLDAAIQATSASIDEETLFIAALERQKRVLAEAGRICPGGLTQSAPLTAWAAALMQAEAIIDAEDAVAAMKPGETS